MIPCPICGNNLIGVERVREERVPSTVPGYFSREQENLYRRTITYEIVKCSKDHIFKWDGSGLRGMANA